MTTAQSILMVTAPSSLYNDNDNDHGYSSHDAQLMVIVFLDKKKLTQAVKLLNLV